MTYEEQAADRHQALKLENNRAIKVAALDLARESGLGNYTVEQLAARAQVSRRTFFNHFGSIHEATRAGLRDILFDASESALTAIAAQTEATETGSLATLFEASVAALSSIDFTPTITEMCSVLGVHHVDSQNNEWFGEVFATVIMEFRQLLAARAPHIDAVSRNLLAESLLVSVRVTAEIWLELSVGLDTAASRQLWQNLYGKTVNLLRSGFAPTN